MKKRFFSLFMTVCLTSCVLGAAAGCKAKPEEPTPEEPTQAEILSEKEKELKQADKGYSHVVYVAAGESYALDMQLKYEEEETDGYVYSSQAQSFTLNNGVITANTTVEDITGEELTITRGEKGEERVLVHVVNREKYGDCFLKTDVGSLYGKKVIFFGDSITHNWAKYPNGDKSQVNQTDSLGYNHIPMLHAACCFSSIVNAGWSGGTMAYIPSTESNPIEGDRRYVYKSFPGGVDEHIADIETADYIFILYGTNDWTEQVPVGNEDDVMTPDGEDHTFYAGLNYGLSRIRAANKSAKIALMTILRRNPPAGILKLNDYNTAIRTGATNFMTKLIDTEKMFSQDELATLTQDLLHPNEEGYRVMTKFILTGKREG